MLSTKQILANRENARHSTGPKTAEGKAKSSQNPTTHGFYSRAFIVREEEKADFELLRAELHGEYDPIDSTAEDFFQQILHASWNLHRLRRIENQLYAGSEDPFGDPATLARLNALRRHKGHFERSLRTARKGLTEYTTAHFNVSTIPPDIRHHFTPSVDVAAYNRAHVFKWKLYTPEDYVSPERLEAARAEHKERGEIVADFRKDYAKRTRKIF